MRSRIRVMLVILISFLIRESLIRCLTLSGFLSQFIRDGRVVKLLINSGLELRNCTGLVKSLASSKPVMMPVLESQLIGAFWSMTPPARGR